MSTIYDSRPSRAHHDTANSRRWGERAQRLYFDVRSLVRDHVELAVLEAQRAGQVLVQTVAAAVAVSVLVATAWVALVAAGIVWLTDTGVSWQGALLIGALANLVVAGGIILWVRKQIPELMFSATLRQLRATRNAAENREDTFDPASATSSSQKRGGQDHEGGAR